MIKKIIIVPLCASILIQTILGMHVPCPTNDSPLAQRMCQEQSSLNEPLFDALSKGDVHLVEQLLNKGVDVNKKNNYGLTPLHMASTRGQIEMVKLLSSYAHMNERNNNGWTALHIVCIDGNVEIARLLITHKDIQINAVDKRGRTPLHLACMHNRIEMVRLLLTCSDIQVNPSDSDRITPLYHACQRGAVQSVKLLLGKIVNPEITWDKLRLLFIGHQKEEKEWCNIALLPREMINHISSFCGRNRKNIQETKSMICHQNVYKYAAFSWARGAVSKGLFHILDPQAWTDDTLAQKTYAQLLAVLKKDESKKRKSIKEDDESGNRITKKKMLRSDTNNNTILPMQGALFQGVDGLQVAK